MILYQYFMYAERVFTGTGMKWENLIITIIMTITIPITITILIDKKKNNNAKDASMVNRRPTPDKLQSATMAICRREELQL